MGANIRVEGKSAIIEETPELFGTELKATDLRAGGALIIAALMAKGESVITDNGYIKRGYANIEKNLKSLGIDIKISEA